MILVGMISPEYEFLFGDVGMNGRNSDGGNWSKNPLKNASEINALNLPEPRTFPGRIKKFHVYVIETTPFLYLNSCEIISSGKLNCRKSYFW